MKAYECQVVINTSSNDLKRACIHSLSLLEPFCIIVEYTCFGSLKTVLENNHKSKTCKGNAQSIIDKGRLIKMAQQVASGMECIASHKVKQ